jgi:hypothetical protein
VTPQCFPLVVEGRRKPLFVEKSIPPVRARSRNDEGGLTSPDKSRAARRQVAMQSCESGPDAHGWMLVSNGLRRADRRTQA